MSRFPRSLIFYVVASSSYAVLVFVAVHATYALELGRSGRSPLDPEALLSSLDAVSFAIWIGLSLIAGMALYRLAQALEGARGARRQREGEISSIFALAQALSGSLELDEIAERFLDAATTSLGRSVTVALYVSDDAAEGLRLIRERGPLSGRLARRHRTSTMPAPIRSRVVDHRHSLVLPDVRSSDAWALIAAALADPSAVRSFAALPLVSHDRLVGMAAFISTTPGAITGDQLQIVAVLTQFVASTVRTALTFAEAEARGNREAIVNRVARRARASLDPDQVLRTTVEALGSSLNVKGVIAALGAHADELAIAHQWTAPGVESLGSGLVALAASRQAAITGLTVQVDDEMSRVATPIHVGGELAGTLSLQTDPGHDWTVDEVRLLEAVARELQVSMEMTRLFQARQRENERLRALQRASAVVAARSTTREVIDEVLRTASSLLGQASASLYLLDEGVGVLRLAQNADPSGRPVSVVLSRGEGMSGDLLATLEPVVVNDYAGWSGASGTGIETGLRAVLAVPLVRAGQLRGAIVLRSYEAHTRFTMDDARLLGLFGDQAVAALTNAEAFERQRAAMEQLERVNRAKSEFVSIVSHEFRTPLTGIQGFSEMMRDEEIPLAEMKEYAADINTDAQRLNRMIDEMLDLDRMEAGRMTIHREPVDLNAIVRDAADHVRPHAPGHPITLDLDPGQPSLSADRDRLTQVVANLLSNAVKYSPTGGAIVVTTAREDETVHLTVRDHGMGIPADMLVAIWERYSRVESDTTRGIRGTGLGLPIVRQLVTMHGGRVFVESEVGRGSVFHVVLPLAPDSQPVQA